MGTWDVVIIGGGPAAEKAQYAIQGSDRTGVIVEAELPGGECSYWACVPSKALLRPVEPEVWLKLLESRDTSAPPEQR